MEEAPHPKGKLSDLVRGDLLPPPPIGRATVAGTGAAMMGAAAWGLIAYYGNVEVGYLAIGIGALIGWVMVKAGGHGTPIAVCAGLLTLLSILSGSTSRSAWTPAGCPRNCTQPTSSMRVTGRRSRSATTP